MQEIVDPRSLQHYITKLNWSKNIRFLFDRVRFVLGKLSDSINKNVLEFNIYL